MSVSEMSPDEILAYPFPDYSWPLAFGISWRRTQEASMLESAIELFEKCRVRYPHAPEFGMELALAYLERGKKGDDVKAELTLRNNEGEDGPSDEETLCRYGRLYKDRGDNRLNAGLPNEAAALYELACRWYEKACNVRQGQYPGINRATLLLVRASLCDNEMERARLADESADLAAQLISRQEHWPRDYDDDNVWHPATAAESHFLRQEWPLAYRNYLDALQQRNCQAFHRNSMYKQAKRIQSAFEQLEITDFGPLADLREFFTRREPPFDSQSSSNTPSPGEETSE
jgi:tetratricopeptide (TPR) repeat protein